MYKHYSFLYAKIGNVNMRYISIKTMQAYGIIAFTNRFI